MARDDGLSASFQQMGSATAARFNLSVSRAVQELNDKQALEAKIAAREERCRHRADQEQKEKRKHGTEKNERRQHLKEKQATFQQEKEIVGSVTLARKEEQDKARMMWQAEVRDQERRKVDERRELEAEKRAQIKATKEQQEQDLEIRRRRFETKHQEQDRRHHEEVRQRWTQNNEARALEERQYRVEQNRQEQLYNDEEKRRRHADKLTTKTEQLAMQKVEREEARQHLMVIQNEASIQKVKLNELMAQAQQSGDFNEIQKEVQVLSSNLEMIAGSPRSRSATLPAEGRTRAVSARAQPVSRGHNTNKTNNLAPEHIKAVASDIMEEAEVIDKNGQLTLSELSVAFAGTTSRTGTMYREFIRWLQEEMKKLDEDNDGAISRTELEKAIAVFFGIQWVRDAGGGRIPEVVPGWLEGNGGRSRSRTTTPPPVANLSQRTRAEEIHADMQERKQTLQLEHAKQRAAEIMVHKNHEKAIANEAHQRKLIIDKFKRMALNQRANSLIQLLEWSGRARQHTSLMKGLTALARSTTDSSAPSEQGQGSRSVHREPLLAAGLHGSIVHVELISTAEALQRTLAGSMNHFKEENAEMADKLAQDLETMIQDEKSPANAQAKKKTTGGCSHKAAATQSAVKGAAELITAVGGKNWESAFMDVGKGKQYQISSKSLEDAWGDAISDAQAVVAAEEEQKRSWTQNPILKRAPTEPDPLRPGAAAAQLAAASLAACGLLPDSVQPGAISPVHRSRARTPGRACVGSAKMAQMRSGSKRHMVKEGHEMDASTPRGQLDRADGDEVADADSAFDRKSSGGTRGFANTGPQATALGFDSDAAASPLDDRSSTLRRNKKGVSFGQ